MTAAGRTRGTQRERAVRDHLRNDDWLAFRAPASLGVADVVALKDGHRARLIEVKSTHRGPYHSFSPADRARLTLAARLAGADAYLAWWPPHGQLHWIHSTEWPGGDANGTGDVSNTAALSVNKLHVVRPSEPRLDAVGEASGP